MKHKRFHRRVSTFVMALLAAGCLHTGSAQASSTMTSIAPNGYSFMEFLFADKGEQFRKDDKPATWNLSSAQKRDVVRAGNLWAEIFADGAKNTQPVQCTVSTYNVEDNAECGSNELNKQDAITMSQVQAEIIQGIHHKNAGYMNIGLLKDSKNGLPYSQIPYNNDFIGSIYHEIGHALGLITLADTSFNPSKNNTKQISVFASHLQDKYGTKFVPNITFTQTDPGKAGTGVMYVGKNAQSGVTFHGKHVQEVMGSDAGMPVNGYEIKKGQKEPVLDLAHLELERSLMSHQSYRNYNTFMEAELALLQDIGYTIDRKKFFGKTIFGDNQVVVNTDGYFARADNASIEGKANTATLGVGLHIYGKHNDVTQAKDLLADGEAGTGIRVDGSDNILRLNKDITVSGSGLNGSGLIVAYGKNHQIISQGNLLAQGKMGVAARFSFGHNLIGDHSEYRGSYILTENGKNKDLFAQDRDENGYLYNLDGPLVKQFDVSGKIAGTDAAIAIDSSAFVQNINILKGARVQGNILSFWDPTSTLVQYNGDTNDLHTNLTFGYTPNSDGSASTSVAQDFSMTLAGNISGKQSLDMKVAGGKLDVQGTVDVYSLENNGHLTLSKNDKAGAVANVSSTFTNTGDATLETSFFPDGSLTKISAQSANLAGTWALRPAKGFYASGKTINVTDSPVDAATTGWFTSFALGKVLSPTLTFALTRTDQASVAASRAANAYSRFAANSSDAELGRALVGVADEARGDMQTLFANLDWSDTSVIRSALTRLGSEAYDVQARASLNQQSELNGMLMQHMLRYAQRPLGTVNASAASGMGAPRSGQWTAWASFFGSTSSQGDHNDQAGWHSQGVGFLGGADLSYESGLTLGLHLGFAGRHTTVDGNHEGKIWSNSAFFGAQALFAPENWDGFYVTGQARIGLENNVMERTVAIGEYLRRNESRWTSPVGSLLLGFGKDFTFDLEQSVLRAGPLVWFEYACMHRPEISESDGKATRLNLDAMTYESLQSALGAHVSFEKSFDNGSSLSLEGLAAWRHELSEGTMRTDASFRSYSGHSFSSETDPAGRDALLLQGSVQLKHKSGFFAEVSLGGEAFRTASSALNGNVRFGLEF